MIGQPRSDVLVTTYTIIHELFYRLLNCICARIIKMWCTQKCNVVSVQYVYNYEISPCVWNCYFTGWPFSGLDQWAKWSLLYITCFDHLHNCSVSLNLKDFSFNRRSYKKRAKYTCVLKSAFVYSVICSPSFAIDVFNILLIIMKIIQARYFGPPGAPD